jgi:hypothetical protein
MVLEDSLMVPEDSLLAEAVEAVEQDVVEAAALQVR